MQWSNSIRLLIIVAVAGIAQSFLWWPLYVKKEQWLNSVLVPSATSSPPKPPLSFSAEVSYRTVYDFIVVGGGTAGSVIASRLAELQQWRILLIEAGGSHNGQDLSWNVRAEPQADACLGERDQRCEIPAGKGLGGNTLINNMLYVRGSETDYNAWAMQGNVDWAHRNVLPYFLKLENFRYNLSANSRQQRGKGGPVPIFEMHDKSSLAHTFVSACNRLGLRTADYNAEANQTVG
ncbi:glucose dehydrogenase [FAD, quinone]-like [Anopheles funestus]|uniref:glucose dehydrogenase [FAD, quinone]-like n=1 Tax=Anopheles funestus TaxID=62324 RepID=UPI0020C69944|nr:glucose dehydrogenase [FAD, quinone]-like [Anopheles funestus]